MTEPVSQGVLIRVTAAVVAILLVAGAIYGAITRYCGVPAVLIDGINNSNENYTISKFNADVIGI